MNLTLRTLLAWLDDTLPPGMVREIGKQVEESPVAQELKERINKVTRQRRLTVPSTTGPDATDPNVVASYLDNELDPDRVVAYEQVCLTSDVHLAEVASAHQILSLIGQKAKVPVEARIRMYALVKGREAIAPKPRRRPKEPQAEAPAEPAQPWVSPEPPRRPILERYGPMAAVVALMAVLCWSAWKTLQTPPAQTVASRTPSASDETVPAPPRAEPKEAPKPKAEAPKPEPAPPEPVAEAPKAAPDAEAEAEAKPQPQPQPNLAAGTAGQVAQTTGVALRYNADPLSPNGRQWERVEPKSALKSQDRILNLQPFRTTLALGGAQVEMVGESEVGILAPLPARSARFSLAQGRVVVHGALDAAPVEVQFAGRPVLLSPPAGAPVGLERLNRREPGSPTALPPALRVYVPEGTVKLKVESAEETLDGPAAVTFVPPGTWTDQSSDPAPSWVTNPAPAPFEVKAGEDFLAYFRPGDSLVKNLNEAIEDDSRDVRRLATVALRATGDVSYVVELLRRPDDPSTRRAAIAALRDYLAQGPDTAKQLKKELVTNFGDQADAVEKLLVGFTPKDAKDEATYKGLVKQLETTDEALVGVRELALDNLRTLTGRDDLGYNPDKPEGKGLKAWQDLLKDHELHPPATTKAKS